MKIEFFPSSPQVELLVPPPKPAAHYVPNWYKGSKKFTEKNINVEDIESEGLGLKSCVPFLDSMINGYIQETWQDIVVDPLPDGKINVRFSVEPDIVHVRDIVHTPLDKHFYNHEFTWRIPWIPKTPKGWSVILTTPFNQSHLPFQCTTGIIDSDNFYHIPFGNYPFYIKEGFRGIIPAGTPMYQIVPIKREVWRSKNIGWDQKEQLKREFSLRKISFGAYKKIFHSKKDFL